MTSKPCPTPRMAKPHGASSSPHVHPFRALIRVRGRAMRRQRRLIGTAIGEFPFPQRGGRPGVTHACDPRAGIERAASPMG